MFLDIKDRQQEAQQFHQAVASILNGYSDKKLHQALVNYVLEFNLNRVSQAEYRLICSALFDKTPETRAFKRHVLSIFDS